MPWRTPVTRNTTAYVNGMADPTTPTTSTNASLDARIFDVGFTGTDRLERDGVPPVVTHVVGVDELPHAPVVGGLPGFEMFLDAMADPSHEEHDRLREWYGGPYV
jgi:hypothetical protein